MNRDSSTNTVQTAVETGTRSGDGSAGTNKEYLAVSTDSEIRAFQNWFSNHERPLSFDVIMPRRQSNKSAVATADGAPKPSRRVHFAMFIEGNNGPVQQVFVYPPVPKAMYPDCFWSTSETHNMRSTQLHVVKQCRASPSNELSAAVLCIYGYARKRRAPDEYFAESQNESVRVLVESDCRGLEYYMADRISQHRSWGIKMILAMQDRYRIQDPDHVDIYLRSFYLKVAAPATRFARMIAKGDEEFVMNELTGASHVDVSFDQGGSGLKDDKT